MISLFGNCNSNIVTAIYIQMEPANVRNVKCNSTNAHSEEVIKCSPLYDYSKISKSHQWNYHRDCLINNSIQLWKVTGIWDTSVYVYAHTAQWLSIYSPAHTEAIKTGASQSVMIIVFNDNLNMIKMNRYQHNFNINMKMLISLH